MDWETWCKECREAAAIVRDGKADADNVDDLVERITVYVENARLIPDSLIRKALYIARDSARYVRNYYCEQVKGPGKFEGEEPYALWFYNLYLSGSDDGDGKIIIDYTERLIFPALNGCDYVIVTENDNGFVHCEVLNCEE